MNRKERGRGWERRGNGPVCNPPQPMPLASSRGLWAPAAGHVEGGALLYAALGISCQWWSSSFSNPTSPLNEQPFLQKAVGTIAFLPDRYPLASGKLQISGRPADSSRQSYAVPPALRSAAFCALHTTTLNVQRAAKTRPGMKSFCLCHRRAHLVCENLCLLNCCKCCRNTTRQALANPQ